MPPGRIPRAFIDDLLARTDIVEVIGSRIQLKKAGREWKANCPFHGEKTPSFTISTQKQFYHCFGCGQHGTALTFLMEHDRLSFPDAVEELASRAGLEVPHEGGGTADPRDRQLEDLYALMSHVDQHFRDALRDSERAKTYLKQRGLVGETAARYHLGYAPQGWDGVLKQFGATEAGQQALLAAGLVIERTAEPGRTAPPGFYDRFRDRVMFPIRDSRGRVVGFGGRIIDQGEPKYLNSPETPLFHKGRELYGLYEARQELRTINRLLVVEGYMDVVRLAQAGVHYAVATLGTATTPDHLNRIFRVTSEVIFAFDGDRAGRQAAWRALETCMPFARDGRQIKFLFLPDGHDPDTLVAEEGRDAFETRLESSLPLSEYLVRHLSTDIDMTSMEGRARLGSLARPLLARVPEGIYRELLIERLAREVRMPAPRLKDLLGAADPSASAGGFTRATAPTARPRSPASSGRGSVLRQAIARLIQQPSAARAVQDPESLRLTGDRGLAFLADLIEMLQVEPHLSSAQVIERWRDRPEHARLAELAALSLPELDEAAVGRELAGCIPHLVAEAGPQRRIDALIDKAELEGLTDEEKRELVELQTHSRTRP
jgi:DNA primase